MKTQTKKDLLQRKKLHYAICEGDILKKLNHPFIIKLHYCFQTPLNIHFILDYCPGIDLLRQLRKF